MIQKHNQKTKTQCNATKTRGSVTNDIDVLNPFTAENLPTNKLSTIRLKGSLKVTYLPNSNYLHWSFWQ